MLFNVEAVLFRMTNNEVLTLPKDRILLDAKQVAGQRKTT